MATKRSEQLRTVRNLNEVMGIVADITKEVTKTSKAVRNMYSVMSATSRDDDEEEININHRPGKSTKVLIKKLKLTGIPTIKKNNEIVADLYDNSKTLESVEALIKTRFSGQKGQKKALEAVTALRKSVEASIKDALDSLRDSAKKHQPEEIDEYVKNMVDFLKKKLDPEDYDKITKRSYVNVESDDVQFCNYVNIKGFNKHKGFEGEDYYFILTAVMPAGGGAATMYLTSVHIFRPPGEYELKRTVGSKAQILSEMKRLMAHDNMRTVLDKTVMPLSAKDARHFKNVKNVKKVTLEDDDLIIETAKNISTKDTNALIIDVMGLLRSITGTKDKINPKVKGHVITFSLSSQYRGTPADKAHSVSVQKLMDLKDLLGLTDNQVQAFKTALKHAQVQEDK